MAHATSMGIRHLQALGTCGQKINSRNVAVIVITAFLSGTMAAAAGTATTATMCGRELTTLMTIDARTQYSTLAIDG
jgi:hypothetical protein